MAKKKKIAEELKPIMRDLISQAEAAKLRGVTRSAIHRLIKRGKLSAVEIGGHTFVSRGEVESFEPGIGGRPRKGTN